MSTKDYLSQAYRIDQRINSKLAQVMSLRDLLGKATGTLSGAPKAATPNPHTMEDTIAKMVDLENEINEDIDAIPAARKAILTDRNRRWSAWVKQRMGRPGTVLMAVGAGHLVGSDGVPTMLEAEGLPVTRVQ